MTMPLPKITSHWKTVHRRYSFLALAASAVVSVAWSIAPPGLPMWCVLGANAAINGFGLLGSYIEQLGMEGGDGE